MQLDDVLELMAGAANAENAGQMQTALQGYRAARDMDPEWAAAAEGIARVSGSIARDRYETEMSNGFTALAAKDYGAARAAFEAAQNIRPSAGEPAEAIAQLEAEQTLAKIVALQRVAETFARNEQWTSAVGKYEEILALDDTVVAARNGAAEAKARAELDARMEYELANTHRFNDSTVWDKANSTLAEARTTTPPGPRLTEQIGRLAAALDVASVPIPVQFRSDNLTQVVVYKVGRLGQFGSRMLSLRPGAYTAVGTRDGYRDVRRDFFVRPGDTSVVELICEEPI